MFFIVLIASITCIGVWFSPLNNGVIYKNNVALQTVDGICYGSNNGVRYDFDGTVDDMYAFLKSIRAKVVSEQTVDGMIIVYAYSDRVCGSNLRNVGDYNVMAVYRDNHVVVGTPIIEGSY